MSMEHRIRATGYTNASGVLMESGDSMDLTTWVANANDARLEVAGPLGTGVLIVSDASGDLSFGDAVAAINKMWDGKPGEAQEMTGMVTPVYYGRETHLLEAGTAWTINHKLPDPKPQIQVLDSEGRAVIIDHRWDVAVPKRLHISSAITFQGACVLGS